MRLTSSPRAPPSSSLFRRSFASRSNESEAEAAHPARTRKSAVRSSRISPFRRGFAYVLVRPGVPHSSCIFRASFFVSRCSSFSLCFSFFAVPSVLLYPFFAPFSASTSFHLLRYCSFVPPSLFFFVSSSLFHSFVQPSLQ